MLNIRRFGDTSVTLFSDLVTLLECHLVFERELRVVISYRKGKYRTYTIILDLEN